MYQVYGSVTSRAFRVLWLLEELGVPYDHVQAGPRSAEVVALNPSGKIPVLIEDGTVLTDSSAIMTYLADKHGAMTYPAGTIERAKQDALLHMLLDEFDAALWVASRHAMILPEEKRVPAIVPSMAWEFGQSAQRLAGHFVGPFLMGDKMTIADILAVHCLGWAHMMKFPVESDVLRAYSKEMRARPAYIRARGDA